MGHTCTLTLNFPATRVFELFCELFYALTQIEAYRAAHQ